MDDQEIEDDQEKQDDQRELLLKIARCEIANERLNLLIREKGKIDLESHDCNAVCKFQYDKIYHELVENGPEHEVTKAMFHVPEPWNGNLKTAEILFVGSNPSIDLNEEDFPKFESEEWAEDKKDGVVDFFSNRLDRLKLGDIKETRYWCGIYKYAAYILGEVGAVKTIEFGDKKKRKIDSRIALTEIVHCKSKDETGVPEAARKCFDKHTNEVIDYFLKTPLRSGKKKIVIFVGAKARNRLCELGGIKPKKATRDQIANICNNELFEEYRDSASFLLLPYPFANQWTFWKPEKPEEHYLNDDRRTKLIAKELEQYG